MYDKDEQDTFSKKERSVFATSTAVYADADKDREQHSYFTNAATNTYFLRTAIQGSVLRKVVSGIFLRVRFS